MKSEAFSLLGKGEISHLVTSTEDMLASSSTVYEGADNEGWEPVLEDNGSPRAIKTDRIIEGYISSERLDNQKDIVPLEAFTVEMDTTGEMPLIEWIAKNSELMWVHGHTDKGSLAIGNVIGYKVEKGRPKFRWGIKKGSTLIDDCWEIMKQHGTAAGFSIGGAKLERECDDNKCILHKLDVVEVSWTPNPANPDAVTTFINKLAKGEEEDEDMEDDEQLEKPCPHRKAIAALKTSDLEYDDKKAAIEVLKGSNLPRIQDLIDEGDELQKPDEEEDDDMEKKGEPTTTGPRGGKYKIVNGKKVYVDGEGGGGGKRPQWSGGDIDPKELRSDYESARSNWSKASPKKLRNALAHAYASGHKDSARLFENQLDNKDAKGKIKEAKEIARSLKTSKSENSASSTGDEHGPSVSTKKGDDSVTKDTEPLEKADEILAGLDEMRKSIDALAKALIKQDDEEEEEDDKDTEKQEDEEEEEDDKDTEKQDDDEEDDKKDEEKSVKKASDEELLGAVLKRGLAPKLMDLQKGSTARPGGGGKKLEKSGDDSYTRRVKARIANAEKLQGAI